MSYFKFFLNLNILFIFLCSSSAFAVDLAQSVLNPAEPELKPMISAQLGKIEGEFSIKKVEALKSSFKLGYKTIKIGDKSEIQEQTFQTILREHEDN